MIGLALILIPAGWVLLFTAINGDGSAQEGEPKTYSLVTAFENALRGSLHSDAASSAKVTK